jgi:TrmH family RNA methyltransferase
MISKQQLSFVRSLHQKKYRQMYGKFLVEGDKLVRELLASSFKVDAIFKTSSWNYANQRDKIELIEVSEEDLRKISTHENPNQVLAVAHIPARNTEILENPLANGLYLACDKLSDPGNAGTLVRTADWFGVENIFFSENSVDIFNPKVVSAAKGSLFRVACHYVDLKQIFSSNAHLPVYGAYMDGKSIYKYPVNQNAILVIGNEANGIGEELAPYITQRISIPNFGGAESLNAAVAAGIILGEFRRAIE